MSEATQVPPSPAAEPSLKLNFLSHGTLESKDLEFTRRFYEQFFGFEVVKASKVSIWCRLGGNHIYVVVEVPAQRKAEMPFLNHNGIDVATEADVDESHRLVTREHRRQPFLVNHRQRFSQLQKDVHWRSAWCLRLWTREICTDRLEVPVVMR